MFMGEILHHPKSTAVIQAVAILATDWETKTQV